MKALTLETVLSVEHLIACGLTNKEVASRIGIHKVTVTRIARGLHGSQRLDRRKGYCPTPEEIETACAVFRRQKEPVVGRQPVEFPIVSARLLFGD